MFNIMGVRKTNATPTELCGNVQVSYNLGDCAFIHVHMVFPVFHYMQCCYISLRDSEFPKPILFKGAVAQKQSLVPNYLKSASKFQFSNLIG